MRYIFQPLRILFKEKKAKIAFGLFVNIKLTKDFKKKQLIFLLKINRHSFFTVCL